MTQRKSLRMKYEGEMQSNGKKAIRTRTYGDIVPETDQATLKKVVDALNGLSANPAVMAEVIEVTELV